MAIRNPRNRRIAPGSLVLGDLFILDKTQRHLPWFSLDDLVVMELPSPLAVDVLIGMDVIRTCKLLVDGPAQHFTLDF